VETVGQGRTFNLAVVITDKVLLLLALAGNVKNEEVMEM
jgi:hypothetical protein